MSDCFKHGWRHAQDNCPKCVKPAEPVVAAPTPVYIVEAPKVVNPPKRHWLARLLGGDKPQRLLNP